MNPLVWEKQGKKMMWMEQILGPFEEGAAFHSTCEIDCNEATELDVTRFNKTHYLLPGIGK